MKERAEAVWMAKGFVRARICFLTAMLPLKSIKDDFGFRIVSLLL